MLSSYLIINPSEGKGLTAFLDKPVKDGTEREEFSVVFGSDQESIALNPIRSRDLEQKMTKGLKRTNDKKSMRSTSRGRSSRAQVFDSRDEGNDYSRSQSRPREPSRANSRPRTSNNIPRPPSNRMQNENMISESRKSRMSGSHDQQNENMRSKSRKSRMSGSHEQQQVRHLRNHKLFVTEHILASY